MTTPEEARSSTAGQSIIPSSSRQNPRSSLASIFSGFSGRAEATETTRLLNENSITPGPGSSRGTPSRTWTMDMDAVRDGDLEEAEDDDAKKAADGLIVPNGEDPR